jgi:uncharacterized protein YlxP (DUF503 family)
MAPFVCLVQLRLHFNDSGSLKGKRKEVTSLKAQLRRRFGAAVSETGGHDTWQRTELLCALVGDASVGDRGAELVRYADARFPDGLVAEVEVRSLGDILG